MPPLTNALAAERWLGPVRDAYAAALIYRLLTNRQFEGDAQTAYTLKLNTTTAEFDVTETDRNTTRNPALPAMERSENVQDELTMRWVAQASVYEFNADILEGPPDKLPVVLRELAYKMALKSDDRIRTIMIAGIPDANDAADTSALQYGDATHYITDAGEPGAQVPATDHEETLRYVVQAIRRAGHIYRANNYWKLGDPSFDMRTPYAVINNALATAIGNYIDVSKVPGIWEEFLRNDGIDPTGVMGAIGGVPVVVSNRAEKFAAGGKQHHPVLIHNPAAITAAFRTPQLSIKGAGGSESVLIEPTENSFDRVFGWTADAEAAYGATVVNPRLLHRLGVRAEA